MIYLEKSTYCIIISTVVLSTVEIKGRAVTGWQGSSCHYINTIIMILEAVFTISHGKANTSKNNIVFNMEI